MALTKGVANGSIVFGFIILTLALGCIAGGALAINKLNETVLSIGLWAGYVSLKHFVVHLKSSGFGQVE